MANSRHVYADGGFDGNIWFGAKNEGRAIVSVKAGGNVGRAMISDLRGVMERLNAQMAVFLTLTPPTKPMIREAATAGPFDLPGFAPVPRLQIVTIEDAMALRHRAVDLPARRDDAFRKPARHEDTTRQSRLDL